MGRRALRRTPWEVTTLKQRIWELDAIRGLCILGMIIVHFAYDIVITTGIAMPPLFRFLLNWGGIAFILISGICVTLGSHSFRRGCIVLACGLIISAVTYAMYALSLAEKSILIYFGILHCLGTCMLLWPLLKKLNIPAQLIVGVIFILFGLYLDQHRIVDHPYLVILGFTFPGFTTSDYFPLLPNLGYFLLGAVLGRTLYRKKQSLFPQANVENPVLRFLTACGKLSLPIYLLHQPVITGLMYLFTLLT